MKVDVRGPFSSIATSDQGFFDEGGGWASAHFALADAREIDEAFADAAETLGDALHALEAVERGGRSCVVSVILLDGTGEDCERAC